MYSRGVRTLVTVALLALTAGLSIVPANEDSLSLGGPNGNAVQAAPATSETRAPLVKAYGRLPLSFEANQGQTDAQVKFVSRSRGYTLFLTGRAEALLILSRRHPQATAADPGQSRFGKKEKPISTLVRMNLVGANATPRVEGLGELPGKANYFIGNDPKKWRTNVPTYAKVNYRAVYRGVDLVYYGNQSQLEHDFVVAPGADPSVITMGIEGPDKLSVNAQGDLVLMMKDGEIRFQKPMIYQDLDGGRHEIAGGYKLHGKHQVGFEIAAYDRTKPLVIDPQLVYSTYLGGGSEDEGFGIALDSFGNAYVTGYTDSGGQFGTPTFPTTSGAFQTALAGFYDAFVTKLNSAGSGLVYSTYLGGSDSMVGQGTAGNIGLGIAVDSSGSAYVAGVTDSTDFPTTFGAFQTANASTAGAAFVTKLNSAGSGLVYSTYLRGSGVNGIAVDSAGSAYVTGGAGSNFPTTPGAFQTALAGGGDAFVTKLNSSGSGLVYSTYLGGSSNDVGQGIAVDSSGNALVTGSTESTNFPTTSGAFQTSNATTDPHCRHCTDAFVTKLNSAGSGLVYSTYLGGSSRDVGQGIAVDSSGNAFVTGFTTSTNFPTTPGAFQTVQAAFASVDAFVTKLNATGSGLVYSTYLGGGFTDRAFGIAVDSSGSAYVTGQTDSTDFPTTPGAFQTVQTAFPTLDAFVTRLNSAGSGLVYSTYLGGSDSDAGLGIAVDSSGSAYVTGLTRSTDFPTTSGAFQTTLGGSINAFVAKLPEAFSTPGGKVTGDGAIASVGGQGNATFGFAVQFTAGAANPTGNLTYHDHAANVTIKALSFNLLVIFAGTCGANTHAKFKGSASVTGPSGVPSTQDFSVELDDCGEPGSSAGKGPDTFSITTVGSTQYAAAGPLVSGNIQIH